MSRSKALQYYITVRLLLAPLMLWTITTLVFLLLRATPGDPADAILGARAPESAKEALREQLGLNHSLLVQYFNYLKNLLNFDLGSSLTSQGLSVWDVIGKHFPATVELSFFSMMVAVIVGVGVGMLSASRPGTIFDLGGRLFGIITYSLPLFWVGMILQLIFSVQLGWFPLGTRFPINLTPPQTITGLYTLDSLLTLNIGQFFTAIHHLALLV
jgi:peptide/nickel transport system permease protein